MRWMRVMTDDIPALLSEHKRDLAAADRLHPTNYADALLQGARYRALAQRLYDALSGLGRG